MKKDLDLFVLYNEWIGQCTGLGMRSEIIFWFDRRRDKWNYRITCIKREISVEVGKHSNSYRNAPMHQQMPTSNSRLIVL